MSGETEEKVSGWTVDTLNAHLRYIFDERDRRYEQRFVASEEALKAAFAASQEALLANRETVAAALTAAKEAVDKAEKANEQRFAAMADKIEAATTLLQLNQGRATEGDRRGQVSMAIPAIVFGAIGTLLGIVGFIYALVR